MKKVIIGIIVGIGICSTVFFWPKSSIYASESEQEQESDNVSMECDLNGIITALDEAGKTISDDDLKQYYSTLVERYDLENTVSLDSELITGTLPDVDHIVKTSMVLPLEHAGEHIVDSDIRDFYYRFLEDAGWEMNQDDKAAQ